MRAPNYNIKKSLWLAVFVFLLTTTNGYVIQNNNNNNPLTFRTKRRTTKSSSTLLLSSVFRIHETFLDGAEWTTVQKRQQQQQQQQLNDDNNSSRSRRSPVGKMTVVIGTLYDKGDISSITNTKMEEKDDVVVIGMQVAAAVAETLKKEDSVIALTENCFIYRDSLAIIPRKYYNSEKNTNWDEMITTYVASLSSIHCALPPPLKNIGGSPNLEFIPQSQQEKEKVVVIGGSEHACFVARGLAAMGFKTVYLITTGKDSIDTTTLKNDINNRIEVLGPSSLTTSGEEMEIGFSTYIGTFDCMVDTIHDERTNMELEYGDEEEDSWRKSGVLTLLKTRHDCHRYVSTMTKSQKFVQDKGIFFGPSSVKTHLQLLAAGGQTSSSSSSTILPPKNFGTTVQTLFDNDITYSWNKNNFNWNKENKKDDAIFLRTWTLSEFWELASWPRDASGSNIRFGFPAVEDLNTIANELEYLEEDEQEEEESITTTSQKNPFVMDINGVNGLVHDIIETEQTALLFLSAPWCRTCKSLLPGYTRMARQQQSNTNKNNILFAKADTSGPLGKELGRTLNIEAIPTFVLFQDGKRYGIPLSEINKLPSKKLNAALELLQTGAEWEEDEI